MKEKEKKKRHTRADDNVVYMNGSEEAGRNNRERQMKRSKMKIIFAVVGVILAIIIGASIYKLINRQYKGYKIVKRNSTSYENTANYIQYNGNLLKYTPDGVSYINSNGDTVWSAGINMNMPIAETSGKYAVVADISGNSVCVFNDEGQVSSLTMPYTICDVDVGKQGAFVVVLESKETNYINLYDKNGELIYEMKTTIDKSGYPLDVTISDNAEKLMSSYINISGTKVQNNLGAYNFGDVGQNSNVDRMVGGYLFEDEVVPKVEFVDNNTIVAFGTKTITVYQMKEKPSKKASVTLETEAQSVFYSSEFFGYVQKATESDHLYEMKLYNMSGKLKLSRYIDFQYENIYAAEKEVIVTGGDNCLILRSNGSCKYDDKLSGKIVSVVPSGNNLEYVVVYEDATEIIKLKAEHHNNSTEQASSEEEVNTVSTQATTENVTTETTTESKDNETQENTEENTDAPEPEYNDDADSGNEDSNGEAWNEDVNEDSSYLGTDSDAY